MEDVPRRCRDCGREKPAPVIPLDAGQLLRDLATLSSRTCFFCHSVKLLAGTENEEWIIGDWSLDDLDEMRAAARKLRAELLLDWRQRKLERERERSEKVQGTLLSGPSAQREADVSLGLGA